jgi:signal transduction histidine kinase
MTRLINNLLSLARLDAGLISAAGFTPVSIGECVDQAVQMTKQLADERRVRITTSVDENLYIMGMQTGLMEAFLNIIENGVRYNREGGTVTVSAVKQDKQAVITVTDTGEGIKEGDGERIFERFYRADTVRNTEGTGLGLSIVKSVINAHGGEIDVRSEPGKGSSFSMLLPITDTQNSHS